VVKANVFGETGGLRQLDKCFDRSRDRAGGRKLRGGRSSSNERASRIGLRRNETEERINAEKTESAESHGKRGKSRKVVIG